MWNRAITLGVKNAHRPNLLLQPLVKRIDDLMKEFKPTYYCACIEDYTTTGYHVHIYFEGPEILWMEFNRRWALGYVKDRTIYDKEGWLKYIKKSGCWWEQGKMYTPGKTPIERFTGTELPMYFDLDQDSSDEDGNLPFY